MKFCKIMLVAAIVAIATPVVHAVDAIWTEYEQFTSERWEIPNEAGSTLDRELARKKYFASHFYGKSVTLTGEFGKSGKAVLGGTYVTVKVGNVMAKVMARPSERAKIAGFSAGDTVTFTGVFKTRGDAMHGVTFEDGIFSAGSDAPAAAADAAVEVTADSALWQEYVQFAGDRYNVPGSKREALKRELARKAEFKNKYYGKTVMLKGSYKSSGKAVLGSTYLSVDVDGLPVKVMMRPSEAAKLSGYSAGQSITFTGTFKSRGDAGHRVTFEDGVIK